MRDELQWLAVKQAGPEAVARFDDMISKGQTVAMAAMLATRKAPSSGVDDRMVMANAPRLADQFKGCPQMLELWKKRYRQRTGEDLPDDAVVFRTCADEPGDADVVVTHKHSLQEVKEKLAARGKEVHGDWEVTPMQKAPEVQKVRINDTAMARYMAEYRADPAYEKASDAELREEIIGTHTKVVTADEVMSAPTDPVAWAEECFRG